MQLGQQAANIYNQQTAAANTINPTPPRTIASAISRMDGVNERLGQTTDHLAKIADALGALRVAGKEAAAKPPSVGAIGRLNDSADGAHSRLADIEDLLSAISSALG